MRYGIGPLLMVLLCWAIAMQLKAQANLSLVWEQIKQSLQGQGLYVFTALLLLMLLNWFTEAVKWKIAIAPLQPIRLFRAFKAVLSGVSFSVSLPNRVGEYLGRVLYLEPSNRVAAVSVTIVSSFSQLIVTILMGIPGLLLLRPWLLQRIGWEQKAWWIALGITLLLGLIMLLLYARVNRFSGFLKSWCQRHPHRLLLRFTNWLQALDRFDAAILLRLLSLSVVRYGIFVAQYYLAYRLFQVDLSGTALFATVSTSFLILAVVPGFALTELTLRGAVALWVAGYYSANAAGIVLAAVTIWFINLILPAVAGALLITGVHNFFTLKDETA